jgi:hypothetical protein
MRFAATVSRGDDAPELRETLRARFGSPALVELGLAVASARFFPAFKRALGHARSCAVVQVFP